MDCLGYGRTVGSRRGCHNQRDADPGEAMTIAESSLFLLAVIVLSLCCTFWLLFSHREDGDKEGHR